MAKSTFFFFIEEITSSFEMTDLENAINNFDEVVLITLKGKGVKFQADNLFVHEVDYSRYKTFIYMLKGVAFFPLFAKEFVKSRRYFTNINLYKKTISSFLRTLYLADLFSSISLKYKHSENNRFFYSFWLSNFALALSVLKQRGTLDQDILVSRVHGTDLFEERIPLTRRIPFRSYQLKYTDKIFSVSKRGSIYLKEKYRKFSHKIYTSYLGTADFGEGMFDARECFTILSCAKVRNIKRIHLIPKILLNSDINIRWIHAGGLSDEDPTLPLFHKNVNELKENNKKVKIDFVGDLSNDEVLKIYKECTINLFLSVSETEGLPVSMMEAISFGVPVMATNVGGCNEIVNENTGILIEKDFDEKAVFDEIKQFCFSKKNTREYRVGVRSFWNSHFRNEINFKNFRSLIWEKEH